MAPRTDAPPSHRPSSPPHPTPPPRSFAQQSDAQLSAPLPCPSPTDLREWLGAAAPAPPAPTPAAAPPSAPPSSASPEPPGPEALAAADPSSAAALAFLLDLMDLAEALGLRALRLALDAGSHGARSLLSPQLAALQGEGRPRKARARGSHWVRAGRERLGLGVATG